jgi:hypothetical protein
MNKRATKRKSATENSMLKFLTVSSVSSDSIVKGIIDDIINTALRHRCLERQAFGTPRKYTLSPSKSINGSNYGDFLKDKHVLLCTRLYKYGMIHTYKKKCFIHNNRL